MIKFAATRRGSVLVVGTDGEGACLFRLLARGVSARGLVGYVDDQLLVTDEIGPEAWCGPPASLEGVLQENDIDVLLIAGTTPAAVIEDLTAVAGRQGVSTCLYDGHPERPALT